MKQDGYTLVSVCFSAEASCNSRRKLSLIFLSIFDSLTKRTSSYFILLCILAQHVSPAAWKLHYYQWAMQIFEQHNMREAACQFALAALEQVDEALGSGILDESATAVKGRLWANVFQFTLDLNYYYDAYCAIISNPDEESKTICLRRFIIVLYERGAVKVLYPWSFSFSVAALYDHSVLSVLFPTFYVCFH